MSTRIGRGEFRKMVGKKLTGKSYVPKKIEKIMRETGTYHGESLSKKGAERALKKIQEKAGQAEIEVRKRPAKEIVATEIKKIQKEQAPKGPSKEELEQIKRRAEAQKVMHLRQRADEIRAEQQRALEGGKEKAPGVLEEEAQASALGEKSNNQPPDTQDTNQTPTSPTAPIPGGPGMTQTPPDNQTQTQSPTSPSGSPPPSSEPPSPISSKQPPPSKKPSSGPPSSEEAKDLPIDSD